MYIFSLAFTQRATGPSSVCEGSDVTLQCVVVFINPDNTVIVQSTVWSRNINGMITPITTIPNHRVVFNSTTGAFTDLVITNVTLEDDNTVYSCSATGATITSSVVLNVTGKVCTCEYKCSLTCQPFYGGMKIYPHKNGWHIRLIQMLVKV